ncbi:hypothetical protein [Krasilnikovia sp. MM14-A1259]|uniref:hypothetical protein n=1 Tax=Krasilnikovia sp. MM14-A1259 TaxID=3373539 RepID=UPI00381755D7
MTDSVPWYVDSDHAFVFEMPTEQLAPLVPPPLQVVEPRPGVGLLWVSLLRFEGGNIDVLPTFHEITCEVVVHPRVADGEARPDVAAFAVRTASDCAQFDDWARRVDRMPVVNCPGLRARVDRLHASCAVADDRGPIFTLASSASGVGWRDGLLRVQVFSHDSDGLWQGWVEWFGSYADHQRPPHPDTRLAHHPFFGELDVGTARCVRQMYTAPSGTSVMKYYAPRQMRLTPSGGSR